MLDTTILKYHEILYAIFYDYNRANTCQVCNKLFNACFELADSICLLEQGGFIDEVRLQELSAIYVLRDICKYVHEFTADVEMEDEESMRVLYACFEEGRFATSLPIVKQHFQTKHGLIETIQNPKFKVNFERLLAYVATS